MLITAPRAVLAEGLAVEAWVAVEDGRVSAMGEGRPPTSPDVVLDRGVLVPGLVDLQVNGGFGVDLGEADRDGWLRLARRLPETGVTSFCPTLITAPLESLGRGLALARDLVGSATGARVLGAHLEGPFLAASRRGAHPEAHLLPPLAEHVDALVESGDGALAIMTLAPELPGALDAVSRLRDAGAVVSLGHSDADAGTVHEAAARGATMVTHLFNAQSPLGHRAPGLPGAALADPRLTCGLIADSHHVAPDVCAIAWRAAPGRLALVSDATAALGMPPGEHVLGGEPIVAGDGPPRRRDGTIAGSALRLDSAIAFMVRDCGADLVDAVAAATRIPADLLGRGDVGRIAPGARADLAWLEDGSLRALRTWVGGEIAWSGRGAA